MIEHRLIERMVKVIGKEEPKIAKESKVDVFFIDSAVDFFRTYADRCHHGKEEDILFRELAKKSLTSEHKRTMDELIEEHMYARNTVGRLVNAREKYVQEDKDALKEIVAILKELVAFYPKHIEREDKHFFIPCMNYFTKKEQETLLEEFWNFDKNLIHEKYRKIVEKYEETKK
ncbi:MAG: hemerythrin domain-containing protein [Candidatus Freyarchaeota archaeon]|nr:hemerythrin domain-containing protein [Candidatus Jordarchaeia archaeon]MBS7268447.1 hemerythrin domain-containing protein [Candidatus Jordarchaeia archaeon]MBS7280936.1 hemerythrin domain-containing protein [Candidatus Jordarchaeia archaeon]